MIGPHGPSVPRGAGTPSVLDVVVERLRGQGPPAHEVWLPPLADPSTLDALLPPLTADPGPRAPRPASPPTGRSRCRWASSTAPTPAPRRAVGRARRGGGARGGRRRAAVGQVDLAHARRRGRADPHAGRGAVLRGGPRRRHARRRQRRLTPHVERVASSPACLGLPAVHRRRRRPADPRVTRQVCPARESPPCPPVVNAPLDPVRIDEPGHKPGHLGHPKLEAGCRPRGPIVTLQLGNQELVLRRRYELLSVINDIGIFLAFTIGSVASSGRSCSTWA